MKKIIISSVFLLVNLIVFSQRNNFGGPSTTYQMQQNAQRATQNSNFQRQQFDQQNRDRQQQQQNRERQQQINGQTQRHLDGNTTTSEQKKNKPKKVKKSKTVRKAKTVERKEPGEEKK